MTTTIQYQVRDTQGGYYNSFKSYTEARALQDRLRNREHIRTIIVEVKDYE